MYGNEFFGYKGALAFRAIQSTSFMCDQWDLCLFGTLELSFSQDFQTGNKLLEMTIDGYGEQIVKILI